MQRAVAGTTDLWTADLPAYLACIRVVRSA